MDSTFHLGMMGFDGGVIFDGFHKTILIPSFWSECELHHESYDEEPALAHGKGLARSGHQYMEAGPDLSAFSFLS